MKFRLMIAVLALSSFAFAQRGGGHPGGGGMGNGAGMGAGSRAPMDNPSRGPAIEPNHSSQPHMNVPKTPDEILSQNTKLSSNLDKLLPPGTTAQNACSGFKNLGQCVAAIHVANNLDIPFANLKAKVTGPGSVSLGKAIDTLKPSTDTKSEVKKAKKQAKADIKTNS